MIEGFKSMNDLSDIYSASCIQSSYFWKFPDKTQTFFENRFFFKNSENIFLPN